MSKVFVLVYEDAYGAKDIISYHQTALSAMAAAETRISGEVKSGVDSMSIYVVPKEDSDYGYRIYCEEVQP